MTLMNLAQKLVAAAAPFHRSQHHHPDHQGPCLVRATSWGSLDPTCLRLLAGMGFVSRPYLLSRLIPGQV